MSRTYSADSLDEEDRARLRQLMGLQRRRALAEIAADRDCTVSASAYGNFSEYGWFDLTEEQCRELLQRGILPDFDAGRLELVTEWPLGISRPTDTDEGDGGYFELDLYSWKKGNGAYNDYRNRSQVLYISREATNTWSLLEQYCELWKLQQGLEDEPEEPAPDLSAWSSKKPAAVRP